MNFKEIKFSVQHLVITSHVRSDIREIFKSCGQHCLNDHKELLRYVDFSCGLFHIGKRIEGGARKMTKMYVILFARSFMLLKKYFSPSFRRNYIWANCC